MAQIFPFRAYRYSKRAGDPACLLTQPYDKITPEMQQRYLALSPYNVAHIIRGPATPEDDDRNNVYTRAARHLEDWIRCGILVQEQQPLFFAYFQKFELPGKPGRAYLRKGLIALGAVEDYSQGTVYRHELTHSGPKRDRLELLRHTRAHFGQIFMLYDDPQSEVDARLEAAAQAEPLVCVKDEYGAEHSLWPLSRPETIMEIQRLLEPCKLLIADGHHRYETALAFRDENPNLAGARRVMMTLVNMRSPGLAILPTHRVVGNIADFDAERVVREAKRFFSVEEQSSLESLEARMERASPGQTAIGALFRANHKIYLFTRNNEPRLDVSVLHEDLLAKILGLTDEAVREERNIRYIRGFREAARELNAPGAQAVFFLNPAKIDQVAKVAFSGGVMPQKSTDFFPKLLSGLTIYKIEE
ncbi:MAG TPA: DUF1015 domain-containing protein [Bryobacterales bacterium]|jgi:uncharacterized protein (DUF1015 family)|nr:DUF1015 domain-containing protein [Bryobacterales bacterium]